MLPQIRPQDIADILIMAFLVYQLYSWFKDTKALQVFIGVLFLGILYFATKNLGLFMTSWILQELGTVLFVLLIVVFQAEIRQALYRFSLLRTFIGRPTASLSMDLGELCDTILTFAGERVGALIVFQREEPLDEHVLHGVGLDSVVTGPLLTSIFNVQSPLHDGAVLIRENRLALASCHLPLSVNADIPQYYGTRHRAALGLSERSDAVVVVVSEERGEVSLSVGGTLETVDSSTALRERLSSLLLSSGEARRVGLAGMLFRNFWQKLGVVLLVFVCWVLITFRHGEILSVNAPVKFHNLPDGLALTRSTPDEVEVQLKSFSTLVASPKELNVSVDLDLSRTKEGVNILQIRKEDIKLPPGLSVAGVPRSPVRVTVEKRPRRGAP
ncbi:diadenylate cyclase CdaA [Geomonas sp. RF6]|uniref:diadenylate cyclase CdaA n=1 Tax=Geomonas sp. RF6 TaxID=2897342 RepID=UPI001E513A41|nr:diadenylate cyclase CdaA [Geomonas sp. RF6]UFS68685.1 diadenylate cyclase CdaA [Geomonas sp. RF6]